MTKAKKAKGKKAQAKNLVPKSVGGMKVPKAMRKSNPLTALFNSGLGREILADALIAAAGAAAAALTRNRQVQSAGRAAVETGSNAAAATGDAVQTAAGAVANVVTEAARSFLPASLVGEGEEKQKTRYVHRSADHSSRKRSEGGRKAKAARKGGTAGGGSTEA
jgi:hypothetical protein